MKAETLSPTTALIAEALQPGPAPGPTALLAALKMQDSPLEALMRAEGDDTITTAIDQDFGFLHSLRMRASIAESETKGQWAALIRWMLAATKGWKPSEDARMEKMSAALLTSWLCGGEAGFWHLLPDESAPSMEFISILGAIVAKSQTKYGALGSATPPIWESEYAEAFQKSDSDGNWADIVNMWPQLNDVFMSDPLFREMVRCLARYGFEELVRATDALQQFPSVIQVARALSASQRLRLAIASGSERVRFCCALVTVTRNVEAIALSADEEATFSKLLIKVATSPDEWHKWMVAFNTYPLRYPALQRPLGKALARAPHHAATVYIDSVSLRPINVTDADESRGLISECLRSFRQQASQEHRHAVWAYAYRRWCDWRFNTGSSDTHLFEISRSSLDFAVISYMYEYMSIEEIETALARIDSQLQRFRLTWHATETDCTTEWNRLLSLFQPYSHALELKETNEDVSPDRRIYDPFNLSNSLYHRIMFQMSEHS